jgi:hypothetical protein
MSIRLTESRLRQIIREETRKVSRKSLNESPAYEVEAAFKSALAAYVTAVAEDNDHLPPATAVQVAYDTILDLADAACKDWLDGRSGY